MKVIGVRNIMPTPRGYRMRFKTDEGHREIEFTRRACRQLKKALNEEPRGYSKMPYFWLADKAADVWERG